MADHAAGDLKSKSSVPANTTKTSSTNSASTDVDCILV